MLISIFNANEVNILYKLFSILTTFVVISIKLLNIFFIQNEIKIVRFKLKKFNELIRLNNFLKKIKDKKEINL